VKKGKSTEIGGVEGSCAGFILLVEGWLEDLVGGMCKGDDGSVWIEGSVSCDLRFVGDGLLLLLLGPLPFVTDASFVNPLLY
jgi:hypothetical protein